MGRRPRAVTIDDVADRAGVSVKTVSRVLNNEPNVRPSKRDVVLQATKELGYRPNPAARSLAGSKSFLIAHLHDNPVPEYIAAANEGIYAACRKNGYFLLPEPVDRSAPDHLDRLHSFLLTARTDGVILTPPLCDDEAVLTLLEDTKTPFMRISAQNQTARSPVFRHDEKRAAKEMVEHLLDLGHKRIAIITGPAGHKASSDRLSGYQDALQGAGVPIDPALAQAGDYTLRSGLEAAQALLEQASHPTAIFATNDDMAVGAITAVLASGLKVPEDISIAGYDNTRLAEAVWPPLTTVQQPAQLMAQRAAERLMAPDPDAPNVELFDFKLIVRGSTGSVKT